MISADHLLTVDIEFDSVDHLNLALEKIRQFIDNLVTENKVSYYCFLLLFDEIFTFAKFSRYKTCSD